MIGPCRPLVVALVVVGALSAIAGGAPPLAAVPIPDGPAPAAPGLTMRQRDDDATRMVVEAVGLDPSALRATDESRTNPERWRSFLVVRVIREGAGTSGDTPSLLGTYHRDGDTLRFEPRFPIEPGVRYRAEFDPRGLLNPNSPPLDSSPPASRSPSSHTHLTAELSIARPSRAPTAIVAAIYPSRAVLPENLLRFYIHFSAPMSRGEAYRHIRLLDGSGRPIEDPFLELDEELWSGDGRRFTLLIDPGRIKRGLRPREEIGPVLEAGRSYALIVDQGWKDAKGTPLNAGSRKMFRAGPADENSPDPRTWTIHSPSPGTQLPLEVRFPEPLDRALLDRLIAVRDGSDHPVTGSVSVSDEETSWRFTPEAPWKPGAYRLVIGKELEDVAGNSIARPFEVDEVRPITRRIVGETVDRPFRIGPASR